MGGRRVKHARVLVAYASRAGSTAGVAEAIGDVLRERGLDVDVSPAEDAREVAGYDAFVVGSAAYFESWLKDATAFVRRHRAASAGRPVWLVSSGPIGTATTDDEGRGLRDAAEPERIAEFREALMPRDHLVFFAR